MNCSLKWRIKELSVQYRTAWYMLQRVREACSTGEFKLEDKVEMDEACIGGKEASKHKGKKLNAGRGQSVKPQ
ncbi:MAG: hypothetical protein OXD29_07950 [Roseovarius sp.]|nr:hypothetical protein [Roseovarius sp.]